MISTIIEDVVGRGYMGGHPYFVDKAFEKWFFKTHTGFDRGDKIRFKVNVEVIEDG